MKRLKLDSSILRLEDYETENVTSDDANDGNSIDSNGNSSTSDLSGIGSDVDSYSNSHDSNGDSDIDFSNNGDGIIENRFNALPVLKMTDFYSDYPEFPDQTRLVDSNQLTTKKVPGPVNQTHKTITEINDYSDYYKLKQNTDYEIFSKHIINHCLESKKLRSWGFTKPQVLIVCPFRQDAYKFVTEMTKLVGKLDKQERFDQEYYGKNEFKNKTLDFVKTFEGNCDDNFKFGLKLLGKVLIPFGGFYKSDIIIASPLALQKIIGETGEGERDFLSSIQISLFFNSHIFMMQNVIHIDNIFKNINLLPKQDRGADISKISNYYLDNLMRYKRQTIVVSEFWTPEIISWQKYSKNVNGLLKESVFYDGCIKGVKIQVPMIFQRLKDSTAIEMIDTRFNYFTQKVLPKLQDNTLIFVPSYFDLLRIQKYLKTNNYSFNTISEYTKQSKVDKSRNNFTSNEIQLLLFSERHYFFKRTKIKSVKHLVFYALPVYPYFHEIVNFVKEEDGSCVVLFSKFDQMMLERVVGSERVGRMVQGMKETFMIVA